MAKVCASAPAASLLEQGTVLQLSHGAGYADTDTLTRGADEWPLARTCQCLLHSQSSTQVDHEGQREPQAETRRKVSGSTRHSVA